MGLFGLLSNSTAWAQAASERLDAIKARLNHVKALFEETPRETKSALGWWPKTCSTEQKDSKR